MFPLTNTAPPWGHPACKASSTPVIARRGALPLPLPPPAQGTTSQIHFYNIRQFRNSLN